MGARKGHDFNEPSVVGGEPFGAIDGSRVAVQGVMTMRFGIGERITKLACAAAVAALGALSVGCGPAPGYEQPEPRMPIGYTTAPAPLTSEQLAAKVEADQQAQQGEVAIGGSDQEYTDTDPSALTEFKPALDGHGQWIEDSTYGTVWQPNESEVGTDFVPYVSAGSWTYDDSYGWTWVSTYDWGWAPFHYGRWVHVGHRGWVWIPGRTYAGAWVVWRYGGPSYEYVGWAPLGPDWYWYHGVAVGWTFGWSPYYVYCSHHHIYDHRVYDHVVQGPPARVHDGNTREYQLANPAVGGAAGGSGSSGGRVAANPSVGGAGGAGARVAANPRIAGPKPGEMGIAPEHVVAPPRDQAGLARAQALSSPRTAVAQGAAPPASRRSLRPNNPGNGDLLAGQGRAPSSPQSLSRLDPVARAPQVQGVSPQPPRQASLPELRPTPRSMSPAPGSSSSSFAGSGRSPELSSRPSVSSSSPPPSSFHSPPPSQPSFRSSPPPSSFHASTPPASSFHSSPPSSSFHSSSPSVHSSAPTFRPSTPSPSRSVSAPSVRSSSSPRRR